MGFVEYMLLGLLPGLGGGVLFGLWLARCEREQANDRELALRLERDHWRGRVEARAGAGHRPTERVNPHTVRPPKSGTGLVPPRST